MGVKTLIFLGIVISALFSYLCIDSKAQSIYKEYQATLKQNVVKKPTTPTQTTPVVKKEKIEVITKKPASFAFVMDGDTTKIAAFLSDKDKVDNNITKKIDTICGNGCIKDIRYLKDVEDIKYLDEVQSLISISKEKKIENFALYIDEDQVKVEGKTQNEGAKESIDNILKEFEKIGYKTINNIKIEKPKISQPKQPEPKPKPKPKPVPIKKEVTKTPIKTEADPKQKVETKVKKSADKKPKKRPVVKTKMEKHRKVEDVKVEDELIILDTDPSVSKKTLQKEIKDIPSKGNDLLIIEEGAPSGTYNDTINSDVVSISYEIEDLIISSPITFASKSSDLNTEDRATLKDIAKKLRNIDGIVIEIVGYGDGGDDKTFDRVLGQKRADITKKYLISQGVKSGMIKSRSKNDKSASIADSNIEIHIREVR
jgi:outer membrane protein OmpA-like peptidoglycan-associated protein